MKYPFGACHPYKGSFAKSIDQCQPAQSAHAGMGRNFSPSLIFLPCQRTILLHSLVGCCYTKWILGIFCLEMAWKMYVASQKCIKPSFARARLIFILKSKLEKEMNHVMEKRCLIPIRNS